MDCEIIIIESIAKAGNLRSSPLRGRSGASLPFPAPLPFFIIGSLQNHL